MTDTLEMWFVSGGSKGLARTELVENMLDGDWRCPWLLPLGRVVDELIVSDDAVGGPVMGKQGQCGDMPHARSEFYKAALKRRLMAAFVCLQRDWSR